MWNARVFQNLIALHTYINICIYLIQIHFFIILKIDKRIMFIHKLILILKTTQNIKRLKLNFIKNCNTVIKKLVIGSLIFIRYWLISNCYLYTVSPNKHGNSVTIFNLSTSVQLGCKINVLRGCVPIRQAEVDYFNIVTELPCLLGHTV